MIGTLIGKSTPVTGLACMRVSILFLTFKHSIELQLTRVLASETYNI